MKQNLKYALGNFSFLLPFTIIKNKKIPFLPFYHLVTDEIPRHIKFLYKPFGTVAFEKHLDFYLKHYKPVEQIPDFNKNGYFLLSFDDGLREIYDIVVPILKRKGVRAVIFVNSEFVDNRDLMFRYKASLLVDRLINKSLTSAEKQFLITAFKSHGLNFSDIKRSILNIDFLHRAIIDNLLENFEIDIPQYLREQKPYMTLNQLKSLEKYGFWIGMHSASHPDFKQLTVDEQLSEINAGLEWHRTNFPNQPNYFAFPFSDDGLKKTFIESFGDLGIPNSFGTAGIKKDICRNHYQRFPVEDYSGSINKIVRGELAYQLMLRIFGKNKVIHP